MRYENKNTNVERVTKYWYVRTRIFDQERVTKYWDVRTRIFDLERVTK